VTAPAAIAYGPGPMTGTVVGQAGSEVCVRLAVSGWRIRWRLQPDGRTVIEAARTLSLGGSATAQRWLLAAVGTRLPRRAMFGLALASAGLSSLIPAGQLPLPPGSPASTAAAVRRALGGYGPWWLTGSPPPSPSWRCC